MRFYTQINDTHIEKSQADNLIIWFDNFLYKLCQFDKIKNYEKNKKFHNKIRRKSNFF